MFASITIKGKEFKEGDVLCKLNDENKYAVAKILKIERFGNAEDCIFHCAGWHDFDHHPSLQEVDKTDRFIMHIPVDSSSFFEYEILGNEKVKIEELEGYNEHLRLTSSSQYLEEMKKSERNIQEDGATKRKLPGKLASLWGEAAESEEGAKKFMRSAYLTAYIFAGIGVFIGILQPAASIFIDVAALIICGIFIQKKKSRVAAIILLVISIIALIGRFQNGDGFLTPIIMTWFSARGIQGTFAWHAFKPTKPKQQKEN